MGYPQRSSPAMRCAVCPTSSTRPARFAVNCARFSSSSYRLRWHQSNVHYQWRGGRPLLTWTLTRNGNEKRGRGDTVQDHARRY